MKRFILSTIFCGLMATSAVAAGQASEPNADSKARELRPGTEKIVAWVSTKTKCVTGRIIDVSYNIQGLNDYYFGVVVRDANGTDHKYESYKDASYESTQALMQQAVASMMSQAEVDIFVFGTKCNEMHGEWAKNFAGITTRAVW